VVLSDKDTEKDTSKRHHEMTNENNCDALSRLLDGDEFDGN